MKIDWSKAFAIDCHGDGYWFERQPSRNDQGAWANYQERTDHLPIFPSDSAERKKYPLYSGLLAYFPSALAAVANRSYDGNIQHQNGDELFWDRAKSGDEADALMRHLAEGDYVGVAWRALALLQKDQEKKGAPIAPAARNA